MTVYVQSCPGCDGLLSGAQRRRDAAERDCAQYRSDMRHARRDAHLEALRALGRDGHHRHGPGRPVAGALCTTQLHAERAVQYDREALELVVALNAAAARLGRAQEAIAVATAALERGCVVCGRARKAEQQASERLAVTGADGLVIRVYEGRIRAGGWSDDLGITEGAEQMADPPMVGLSLAGARIVAD